MIAELFDALADVSFVDVWRVLMEPTAASLSGRR
jgi:hypothetical protein